MKFVHLSDLHLGKRVNEFSMIEDQEHILKEIITIINDIKPDGVLIAGDVYDRTVPSEDAMILWDEFLTGLAKKNIPVFAISGNHDSAIRFSDHSALVETTGIHLSPEYDGSAGHYVLEDKNGPVNIYLLPFIKPATVRGLFPDDEIADYTDACRVAISHMNVNKKERNILVAHQMITGSSRCDSEEVSVGGLDGVDVSVFDDFDYVALGHLHGKQGIGRDTVRYCGSPLKYSFSEKDHVKSVTIVDMGAKGEVSIDEVALVPRHDMREVRGTYEEVMSKKNYEGTDLDDYIHVVLTDENDVIDAMAKLRVVYPNIMKMSYDNKRTKNSRVVTNAENIEKKSPLELFEEFYEKQNNQDMTEEQRKLSQELIESIWEV